METEIPEINVGVVGHIDHGKTTLLSKISGKFTDTHSEELKRGITIKLGYSEIIIFKCGDKFTTKAEKDSKCIPVRYVSFIDAPGHEMLMATMLSGAAIIDAAILVIAANEGIKPQTKEHFMALQAKKIKNIIIVQNKIDLVTEEQAQKNYQEIKNFVKGTIAENSTIIPVSAQQDLNIEKIYQALAEIELPKRDKDSKPIFLIARSFDVNKPGTEIKNLSGGVLGGILKQGELKAGEEIEIKPGLTTKKANKIVYETLKTKIISIHKGDRKIEKVSPGASISIETELDPIVTKADSLTGCLVSTSGNLPDPVENIKLKYSLFDKVMGISENKEVEKLKLKEMLMISINTTISVGTVEKINPNEIELKLNIPVIALKGDNVGMARNINSHWRLIGFGEIV